jgi:tetratricopeptide (TPR) repeat protein
MARLYLVRKQYREAQNLFHKLTVEQPRNALYWNELGISLHNQGDLASALKCYERSAKLDPKYPDPQNNVGTIWYERKKYGRAIRSYKRAITIRNDSAAFFLNLGYAYFGQKEYPSSIEAFQKALQLDPDAFDVHRSRGGTVIQDRSLASERGLFYFLLAKSFAQAGNVDRCIIYLKKAKDDGYKEMDTAKTDPAFALVIHDPAVQDVLASRAAEGSQP